MLPQLGSGTSSEGPGVTGQLCSGAPGGREPSKRLGLAGALEVLGAGPHGTVGLLDFLFAFILVPELSTFALSPPPTTICLFTTGSKTVEPTDEGLKLPKLRSKRNFTF